MKVTNEQRVRREVVAMALTLPEAEARAAEFRRWGHIEDIHIENIGGPVWRYRVTGKFWQMVGTIDLGNGPAEDYGIRNGRPNWTGD